MKPIKHIALGAFLTLSVFCAVLYSSCSKDACASVTCYNKSVCRGGYCSCPIPGTGGNNCEIVYRNRYAHTYAGNPPGNPGHTDSNNTLVFLPDADTANFNTMYVHWNDTGVEVVTLKLLLANNSNSGSTFTIPAANIGSSVFTGSGTISATVVSMQLKEAVPGGGSLYYNFINFYRKP